MHKQDSSEVLVFAGIDVSARELVIAVQVGDNLEPVRSYANTTAGYRQLQHYLHGHGHRIRVCLEASGNYSVDLCLALHADKRIELSVINPRLAWRFAESLGNAQQNRSGGCTCALRIRAAYATGAVAAAQFRCKLWQQSCVNLCTHSMPCFA